MRSTVLPSDLSNKHLLAGMIAMLVSIPMLTMLTQDVFADPDKFGIEELYPTANGGPVWFLNNEQPEADDNFLMTSANNIELEEEDSDAFALDAETGTEKHGVRLHADSPDGEWKNVEMTGYFKLHEGNDQFTLIARQGPTYNEDGGCGAYGYYGMLSANGDAYFKKKLFHHGGYSDRTAVRQGVVGDLNDRWVGIKMIAHNLDGGDVKLELWVDDGDETNDWQKATEYVDDGNWEVAGSDCDRDGDEEIDEGTRGGFRVDDSQFEFKKLSIREIVGPGDAAETALMNEGEAVDEGEAEEVTGVEETEDSDLPTVEIVSNGVGGVAPATFRFSAYITGGTEPYTISWDLNDDGIAESNEQTLVATFNEAGTYDIVLTVADIEGQIASDTMKITVEEGEGGENEGVSTEVEEEELLLPPLDEDEDDNEETQIEGTTQEQNQCDSLYPIACIPSPSSQPNLTCNDIYTHNFGGNDDDNNSSSDDMGCEIESNQLAGFGELDNSNSNNFGSDNLLNLYDPGSP